MNEVKTPKKAADLLLWDCIAGLVAVQFSCSAIYVAGSGKRGGLRHLYADDL